MRKDLKVKAIPVPEGSDHPEPPHGMGLLPIHEFTMGLIAPKGKGKTTTIINLLDFYKGYFHQIWVFSPTIKSDVKWKYAQNQETLGENTKLKQFVLDCKKKQEVNGPVQPVPISQEFANIVDLEKKFDAKIPKECFIDDQSIITKVKEVLDQNKRVVDILDKHNQLKTMADRILLICDDQVGSDLFLGPLKKYFVGANTRHRHHSASIIMVSQGYKEIPKTIRTGWTCLLLYKIGNMKELEVIYEEFSMDLTWDEWIEVYREATNEKHSFLFIDMYGDEDMRLRKGFDVGLVY